MPPYEGNPSVLNLCTPGLAMSIPIPAGTRMCLPSMKTSRCECTWYCNCSAGSGTRPAARARAIGSLGAGHGAGSFDDGVGAVMGALLPEADFGFDELPHAATDNATETKMNMNARAFIYVPSSHIVAAEELA